jgi:hypothetical protein
MWTILESNTDKTAHLPEFDEPLLLGAPPPARRSWFVVLANICAILFLSVCFIAQLVYFNKDALLRDTRTRDILTTLCTTLACELPVVRDPSLLRSTFLDVSSHPEYESLLLVRFSIRNTALFAQPFPSVDMTFSNISQQPVAGRRFYPGHYLDASLLSHLTIPAGAEVQGKLEILDPGVESVNYTVEFVYEHN